jgi:cytochrome c-type biogenesis protein CcmH
MRETPDDLGGWMLLGRAYKSMQRFDPAREALANAYRLAPKDPDVMVEYAEAITLASDSRRIEGEASRLLDAALVEQPTHPRALWLTGIRAYQAGEFANAAVTWETLRDSLPAEDPVRGSLDERIAGAAAAGSPACARASATPVVASAPQSVQQPPAPGPAPTADAVAGSASLTVQVDIAPGLKQRLGASDVLFVFARAPEGSRMPLAIQRLSASDLPVTVTLDDSTSMMPQLKLSTLPEVVVGARVSKSGQAVPQPGDLEALSDPVRSDRNDPVRLTIDRVVE